MIEKLKKSNTNSILQALKDVRVLGLIAFCVIVLLVSWSGVRVIETNYELQRQIARMEEETKLLELENINKKLENEYYNTDQYLELQARKQFGKAAPGETVLIVPESVALSHTKDLGKKSPKSKEENPNNKPFYQKNFEAWMSFFFRRSSSAS